MKRHKRGKTAFGRTAVIKDQDNVGIHPSTFGQGFPSARGHDEVSNIKRLQTIRAKKFKVTLPLIRA